MLMEAGEETRPVLTGRFRADLARRSLTPKRPFWVLLGPWPKVPGSPLKKQRRITGLSGCQTMHEAMNEPFVFIASPDSICQPFFLALKRWPVMSSADQSIWPPPGIRQRRIPLLFYTSKRPLLCLAAKEAKWHQRKLLRNYLLEKTLCVFSSPFPRVGLWPTLRPRALPWTRVLG